MAKLEKLYLPERSQRESHRGSIRTATRRPKQFARSLGARQLGLWLWDRIEVVRISLEWPWQGWRVKTMVEC